MRQGDTKNKLPHKLNHTSVPDAAEGWEAMQSLLDFRAATKKQKIISFATKRVAIAAACLVLIGFSIWQLVFHNQSETPDRQNMAWVNNQELPAHSNTVIPSYPQSKSTVNIDKDQPEENRNQPAVAVNHKETSQTENGFAPDYPLPLLKTPKKVIISKNADMSASALSLPHNLTQDIARKRYTTALLAQQDQTSNTVLNPEKHRKNAFHISVKLKANGGASFGQPQENFNPVLKGTPVDIYPAVYVSKPVSDKVGLQAGLAVVSPVDISNAHLNRSIPNAGRSMVAMAVQSRDNFQISRLYYVDIPITVQYHLTNRFSVGSGLQLSILEKVIGRQQRVDYDANYMVMYAAPSEPAPTILSGDQDTGYGINPLDLRWLGTLNYLIGEKWMASFQLQYGLLDISDNQAFLYKHRDHNVVVSAGVGFLIR